MIFKKAFLLNYLKEAPVSLAVERSLECEILSKQSFKRPVLDIGSGEGLFAYILFAEQIDTGIEPNPVELKQAQAYNMYSELIQCHGDNIPKEAKSFNTIFSNSVLEHIVDIQPVLREAHRLLADDGTFYASVPTNLFDHYSFMFQLLSRLGMVKSAERYRAFFNKFWKHYHYYDVVGWKNLFRNNGFDVVDCQEYGSKKVCVGNDMLIPFSFPAFVTKKLFNRWFISRQLRAFIAPVLQHVLRKRTSVKPGLQGGGIVYFTLKKMV